MIKGDKFECGDSEIEFYGFRENKNIEDYLINNFTMKTTRRDRNNFKRWLVEEKSYSMDKIDTAGVLFIKGNKMVHVSKLSESVDQWSCSISLYKEGP